MIPRSDFGRCSCSCQLSEPTERWSCSLWHWVTPKPFPQPRFPCRQQTNPPCIAGAKIVPIFSFLPLQWLLKCRVRSLQPFGVWCSFLFLSGSFLSQAGLTESLLGAVCAQDPAGILITLHNIFSFMGDQKVQQGLADILRKNPVLG